MKDCTCLGTCKGKEALAPGWRCALEPSVYPTAIHFDVGSVADYIASLARERAELLAALKAVSETGDDCPMCDRGRLRNPEKSHWPECPFGRAQVVIAKAEGRS